MTSTRKPSLATVSDDRLHKLYNRHDKMLDSLLEKRDPRARAVNLRLVSLRNELYRREGERIRRELRHEDVRTVPTDVLEEERDQWRAEVASLGAYPGVLAQRKRRAWETYTDLGRLDSVHYGAWEAYAMSGNVPYLMDVLDDLCDEIEAELRRRESLVSEAALYDRFSA